MRTFEQVADAAKSRIVEVSREAVEARIGDPNVTTIDVREQDEFRAGHVPGALGIGRGILEYHIADVAADADREIVLYCRGGNRSALAADSLQDMGYTNVRSMAGGFREWSDEGRPVSWEGEPIVH